MFSPAQLRAARALLGWSRDELAAACGLSAIAIKAFESGDSDPRVSTLLAFRAALSRAGVMFIDQTDWHGPGVAFAKNSEAGPRRQTTTPASPRKTISRRGRAGSK